MRAVYWVIAAHAFSARTLGVNSAALSGPRRDYVSPQATAWLLRRDRRPVRAATALFLAPFPLLALQPYGGEILIRVALFALPFGAYLAAAGLVGLIGTRSVLRTLSTAAVILGLLTAFVFARYGNDRMDAFSRGDVAGVRALYRIAPPGSELIAASEPLPWQYRDYTGHTYQRLTTLAPGPPPPRGRPHRQVAAVPLAAMTALVVAARLAPLAA